MGLTEREISSVHFLRTRLLKRIDAGAITLVPAPKWAAVWAQRATPAG